MLSTKFTALLPIRMLEITDRLHTADVYSKPWGTRTYVVVHGQSVYLGTYQTAYEVVI